MPGGTATIVFGINAQRVERQFLSLVGTARNWDEQTVAPRAPMSGRWIDLDDIEAPNDDLRRRGFAAGAARFARGEGMWYGDGSVFFACTNGGRIKRGQIWKYTPSPQEGTPDETDAPGTLELFVEPNDGGC